MTPAAQQNLGLFPECLPAMPRVVDGFMRDDDVWIYEGQRRIGARVIAALRSRHQVVVKTDDHRLHILTPAIDVDKIAKRNPET